MINIVEKKLTHIQINPYRQDLFGVGEMISRLKRNGYKVKDRYCLKTKCLDIYIDPPINHHVDIIQEKDAIKWIGPKNLK